MQQAQPARSSAISFPKVGMLTSEQWLIGAHIITALAALSIGIFLGPFQIFRRAPMLEWKIPVFSYYYQALTVHGVMNAIFFTTFFIVGFSYFVVTRSLQRDMWSSKLAWAAYWSMLAGILLVLYPLVTNQANVLYTFYPSMVAHPTFYIGLVLLVVGTWMVLANILLTYRDWRREHPGERVPLAVYGTIANFVLWTVATIGVAIEVLIMLLPLSLGLIQYTDPQTARALFWFFGHPLVYFWLLPAYISWYTMLPKHTGSKILSDPLARVAFLMLMVFSIPVGVHHMFTDPGISAMMKGIHTVFTFVVAVPSFLTAFNIGAMLERSGRQRGATGIFDWLWKQDWRDPVIASQLAGMILFIAGGFSGIINASLTLNIALHNTSWIPAHFHMTLAGAVTMTYFGIMYWMLPMIRGRALYSKKVALWQVYTWLAGMAVFGHAYGHAGILGVPRRTDLGAAPYVNPEAVASLNYSVLAGVFLLVSSVLLFVNIFGTLFFSKEPNTETAPIETKSDSNAPMWLERWGFWLGVVLLLTLFAWGPVFVETIDLVNGFNSPGYRPESITPLNP